MKKSCSITNRYLETKYFESFDWKRFERGTWRSCNRTGPVFNDWYDHKGVTKLVSDGNKSITLDDDTLVFVSIEEYRGRITSWV